MKIKFFFLILLLCVNFIAECNAAPDSSLPVQEMFVDEARFLAKEGELRLLMQVPHNPVSQEVYQNNLSIKGWKSTADRFAAKWGMKYEVVSGFLLIAPIQNHETTFSILPDPFFKEGVKFIQSLNQEQVQNLVGFSPLKLSNLSLQQKGLLSSITSQLGNRSITIDSSTGGELYVWGTLSFVFYSNGRLYSAYNFSDGDIEAPLVQSPLQGITLAEEVKLNSLSTDTGDFMDSVVFQSVGQKELLFDSTINKKSLITSSAGVIPSDVAVNFLKMIDTQIRSLGQSVYIGRISGESNIFPDLYHETKSQEYNSIKSKIVPLLEVGDLDISKVNKIFDQLDPTYIFQTDDDLKRILSDLSSGSKKALENPVSSVGFMMFLKAIVKVNSDKGEVKRVVTIANIASPAPYTVIKNQR